MTKPTGIRWLEQQTGQDLDRSRPESDETRHLSLRVPGALYAALEDLAATQGVSISQLTRQLLGDGLTQRHSPQRAAIDTAIALLDDLRQHLPANVA